MSSPSDPLAAVAGGPLSDQAIGAVAALLARVAAALEHSLPVDRSELVLRVGDGRVQVLARQRGVDGAPDARAGHLTDYSERLWPGGAACVIDDARATLDPSRDADRRLLEAGARSLIAAPLGTGPEAAGLLIVSSTSTQPFAPSHLAALAPFAELLALGVDRERDQLALALAHGELARRAADEDRRQRRFAALEILLPRLAILEDLDDIAVGVSQLATGILDHDSVAVLVLHSGGAHVHGIVDGVHRRTVDASPEFVEDQYRDLMATGSLRVRDLAIVDEARQLVRQTIARAQGDQVRDVVAPAGSIQTLKTVGLRSEMRVAIRQGDDLLGMILFASRRPDHFTKEDVGVARRIADRVSLRIAQERVEGESRRAREASARASALEERVASLQRELERFSAHRAIGQSAAWKKALTDATQVAATETTVLVTGESGTGKEVIARYIHRGSQRAKGPFVALNCAALPEQLLESELFGHERGAFTGATESRAGKIEQASGGVLFLDEVGEMLPAVQAKFLRVLQEREFQRVGGTRTIRADVRIVSATNRDPRASIANGTLREDLYYRLAVFEIHLPALRERPGDILVLAEAFLDEVGRGIGRPAAGISEDAREQLLVHGWPGNVRELRNAIERAVILCHGGLVTRDHLPITVMRPAAERVAIASAATSDFPVEGVPLGDVERDLVVKAMAKASGNKVRAAKLLGLTRGQLYSLLRRHGLTDARR